MRLGLTLQERWYALTRPQQLLIGGGAVGLLLLLVFRKQVGKGVSAVELAAVRALLPKGAENLADLAFELAPQYGLSPYMVLGMTFAESNFGKALTPPGPGGTGDFIPRQPTRCVVRDAKGACTKTLAQLVQELNFPVQVQADGQLKPTTRGWGHGLYQIDLMTHYKFIATGKWSDPREAMRYALDLYAKNKAQIQKALPNLGTVDLMRATIASYNAGAGAVINALKAGKSLDSVTYHPGYVAKIEQKAMSFLPTGQKSLAGLYS